MIRLGLVVLSYLYILPYWWGYKVNQLSDRSKHSLDEAYAFIHHIATKVVRRARVNIECYGLENLPQDGGYLLTPNHQGLFDPLVIFQTHIKSIRAIVKIELTKTILIKDVVRLLEYVPMDRSNVREATKTISYVSREIVDGQRFFVFPEGTRSRNGNQILEFKGGTFKIALKAKCPIVPVAMIDNYKVFDDKSIRRRKVKVFYLEPITFTEYQGMKTKEIAKLVHDRIEECIKNNT